MPERRIPRPLRTAFRPPRGAADMRDYDSLKGRGKTPSQHFNWDYALYKNALTLQSLGYELTPEQQKRIDDHESL